jgi:phosphoglycerate kinase
MDVTPITDIDVAGKVLVVRADLNVPMQDGRVSDATRIARFADGMKPLLAKGARLVVLSHFGRPKGKVVPELSLAQIRGDLGAALGVAVGFVPACHGAQAEDAARNLKDGEVLLCENLRFEPGEEANNATFAQALAALGDAYVNDAFSCAHRAHASTAAITQFLPAYAGPLLATEIDALTAALEAPQRPSVAIVGGAKISTKIPVLKNMVAKLDAVIIGGAMANTFLYVDGAPMGKSLHEVDQNDTVNEIRALAAKSGCKVLLPAEVVCAADFKAGATALVTAPDACPEDMMILDAGPRAVADFAEVLKSAKTILWNGPLGAFEIPPFDAGTTALAQVAAALVQSGSAVAVAGGGDTVSALKSAGVADQFTYVSSAGGAFLEWLEGKTLPGIAALSRKPHAA